MDDWEIEIVENPDLAERARPFTTDKMKQWGNPNAGKVRVFIRQSVVEMIQNHAKGTPNIEIGGVLVGRAYRNGDHLDTEVMDYIFHHSSEPQQSSAVHFNFSPSIWAALNKQKDNRHPNLELVGWFHSHPNHGIFLSPGMDIDVHQKAFNQPWQIAIVYDPQRHEGGVFTWQGEEIKAAPGFYELFASNRQQSIINWRNLEPSGAAAATLPSAQSPQTAKEPTGVTNKAAPTSPPKRSRFSLSTTSCLSKLLQLVLVILLIGVAGYGLYRLIDYNQQQQQAADQAQLDQIRATIQDQAGAAQTRVFALEIELTRSQQEFADFQAGVGTLGQEQMVSLQAAQVDTAAQVATLQAQINSLSASMTDEQLQPLRDTVATLNARSDAQATELATLQAQLLAAETETPTPEGTPLPPDATTAVPAVPITPIATTPGG